MKALNRIMRVIWSKKFAVAVLIILQLALMFALVGMFAYAGAIAYVSSSIIAIFVIMILLGKDDINPAYKLIWVVVMILMPVFGVFLYILWGHRTVPRGVCRTMQKIEDRAKEQMVQDDKVMNALRVQAPALCQNAQYLLNRAEAPLYEQDGQSEFYPVGEDFLPRLLEELEKAERYIFMEYYILEEGVMLNGIVDVLRRKAEQGVDVRFIWDGFGCLMTLPKGYAERLRSYGIKCHVFSPLKLSLRVTHYAMLNHRDHRKITVIDGKVGFSGGLNLADEYINVKKRFGQWKDTAVMIQGRSVASLASIFLRTWDYLEGGLSDVCDYLPEYPKSTAPPSLEKGYVQPYCDSPLDAEAVSESAYLNVIRHATKYVYISTPYLILDYETITNLTLAAKSGVDVRILTPGIPDKRIVFMVTQSYYPALLKEGVRIYEYTPGFNHAKMYVSDDATAIVGSANMDYRSLYLHFESCAVFYGGDIVPRAKQDMLRSFELAREITLSDTQNTPFFKKIIQVIAKFFSPLM